MQYLQKNVYFCYNKHVIYFSFPIENLTYSHKCVKKFFYNIISCANINFVKR